MVGVFIESAPKAIRIHTKFVPDLSIIHKRGVTPEYVRGVVTRSIARLGVNTLHLVQFHWWDYTVPGYMDALRHLTALKHEGLIQNIGVTNFDAQHVKEMLAGGLPVSTNQVQYSLLDRRVEKHLSPLCAQKRVGLLCYGVLAGGFLSDKWLGRADPSFAVGPGELRAVPGGGNRSLTKYRAIIAEFGGWDLFQRLLRVLKAIGDQINITPGVSKSHEADESLATPARGLTISEVSMCWVLQQKAVHGIIIGCARTQAQVQSIQAVLELMRYRGSPLKAQHFADIAAVLERAKGPRGPFYAIERDSSGEHARIMRYDLNCLGSLKDLENFSRLVSALQTKLHAGRVPPELVRNRLTQLRLHMDAVKSLFTNKILSSKCLLNMGGDKKKCTGLLITIDAQIKRLSAAVNPTSNHKS